MPQPDATASLPSAQPAKRLIGGGSRIRTLGPPPDTHAYQCRQNVGREHIDREDAWNSGLHLHPPLTITNARIVDYSVEAAELIDLVGKCSRPSDGGEVPTDSSLGAGCRRERFATSTLVSPVQYDLMALVNQE